LDFTKTALSPGDADSELPKKSSKAGVIAGSTIGIILFLLLIGGLFWVYRRRRQDSFYAAPYSNTKEQTSNHNKLNIFLCTKKRKTKTFGVSSGSTNMELPRPSMGSSFAVPMVGTSENNAHGKDYSTMLEENMRGIDIQQTNFMIVQKSPLRVTNPDNVGG